MTDEQAPLRILLTIYYWILVTFYTKLLLQILYKLNGQARLFISIKGIQQGKLALHTMFLIITMAIANQKHESKLSTLRFMHVSIKNLNKLKNSGIQELNKFQYLACKTFKIYNQEVKGFIKISCLYWKYYFSAKTCFLKNLNVH